MQNKILTQGFQMGVGKLQNNDGQGSGTPSISGRNFCKSRGNTTDFSPYLYQRPTYNVYGNVAVISKSQYYHHFEQYHKGSAAVRLYCHKITPLGWGEEFWFRCSNSSSFLDRYSTSFHTGSKIWVWDKVLQKRKIDSIILYYFL